MKLTDHFMERWVERVEKREFESRQAEQRYIKSHFSQLQADIRHAYENATFIWEGKLSNHYPKSWHYLYDDIILVTNERTKEFITCYKVDLPMPPSMAKRFIDLAVSAITKDRKEIEYYARALLSPKDFWTKQDSISV